MINQTTLSFGREFFRTRIGARQAKRIMSELSRKEDTAGGLGILSGLGEQKSKIDRAFQKWDPGNGTKKRHQEMHQRQS